MTTSEECRHHFENNLGGAHPTFCRYCLWYPNVYDAIKLVDEGKATMHDYLYQHVKSGDYARRGMRRRW